MGMIAQLGDIKIDFNTPEELKGKLETKLKEIDENLKKLNIETKRLNKQRRAVKKALAGNEQ